MVIENINNNIKTTGASDSSYNIQKTVSVRGVQEEEEKISLGNESLLNNINGRDMEKQVSDAIDKVNTDERFRRTGCEFTYHKESKRISITLYDKKTKEVIKEIPPEDTLKMLDKMHELAGLIMDERK